ncbi:MAG: 50S ribosomal protein L21 [Deltaproteobacteria bacterium]|nr:50S ribosomal protein L21 [Deltaproteobacteria bacterium]
MYAIVRTGGKQYRVAPGDTIQVEKLPGDAGAAITLDDVLMLVDGEKITLGKPSITGASVAAEVVKHDRARKVLVFKYRRRKRYRRKVGHRQPFTALRITAINAA